MEINKKDILGYYDGGRLLCVDCAEKSINKEDLVDSIVKGNILSKDDADPKKVMYICDECGELIAMVPPLKK